MDDGPMKTTITMRPRPQFRASRLFIPERLKRERGYALLLTIAVLFGMLSLVLPLARMNSDQIQISNDQVDETRAQWIIESGRNMAKFVSNQAESGKSQLQKTYVLPGWESFPVRMKLKTSPATVSNILPFVMQMAKKVGTLSSAVDCAGAIAVTGLPTAISHTKSKFFIVEGELIEGTGGRGKAGVRKHHPAGADVFAVPDALTYGFLHVNDEWIEVDNHTISGIEGTFSVLVRGYAGTPSTATHPAGSIVEFYPAYPDLRAGYLDGYVRVDIEDERSRINVNSLTSQMSTNLFGAQLGDTAGFFNASPCLYPIAAPEGVLRCRSASPYILSLLTTYSEPDYAHVLSAVGPSGIGATTSPSRIINATPSFPAAGSSVNNRVLIHSVNFNTASVSVMAKVMETLGALSVADAFSLAKAIDTYRSGETTETLPAHLSGAQPDYLDGDENPFDGLKFVFGKPASTVFCGSPQEEFRAFLRTASTYGATSNYLDNSAVHIAIMKHVYYDDLVSFFSQTNLTSPITFETGSVKTVRSTVCVGSSAGGLFVPNMVKSETAVVKDTQAAPIAANTYNLVLNSESGGWNDSMSTFYGFTGHNPVCGDPQAGAGEVRLSTSPSVGGALKVYTGPASSFDLYMRRSLSGFTQIMGTSGGTNNFSVGSALNCGLRLAVNQKYQYLQTVPKVTGWVGTTLTVDSTTGFPNSGAIVVSTGASQTVMTYNNITSSTPFTFTSCSKKVTTYTPAAGDTVVFFPYTHAPTSWGADFIDADPFYETALVRNSAKWETITVYGVNLDDLKLSFGATSPAPGGGAAITSGSAVSVNQTQDVLYLRLTYNRTAAATAYKDASSPQVFSIVVKYTLLNTRNGKSPTQVVLNR